MGLSIGIAGAGAFAQDFFPLFQAHPLVERVTFAETDPERRSQTAARFGISEHYPSYEDMLAKADIDCVAIFVPRHLHGPFAITALNAGKHVYSAVPIAISAEEIKQIVDLVEKTRRIYMIGETCYYFPCAMYCRRIYREKRIGEFVFGESQYYHDMNHGFYDAFRHSGGKDWKRIAGLPPFYYPTHSVGMMLSALDAHAVKVTAMGYRDHHEDGIFGEGKNNWDNPFSNESMLMRLSNGGVARINEFRRIGLKRPSSYITAFYGTMGGYEGSSRHHVLQEGGRTPARMTDVSGEINSLLFEAERDLPDYYNRSLDFKYDRGFSKIQNVARLPKEFDGLPNSHNGSHQFLVDDFLKSVTANRLPPNHAWAAARYMLPGITGHESALKDGTPVDVPDFGDPPADWKMLDPDGK